MVLKLIVENDRNELSVFDFDGNFIAVGRAENLSLIHISEPTRPY